MAATYAEQLKHPNWQRKRLEVLSAADFKCACCGDPESTLNVHHKKYIKGRKPWEYELNELESLCEACHQKKHWNKDAMEFVLSQKFMGLIDGSDVALGVTCGILAATDARAKSEFIDQKVVREVFVRDTFMFLLGYAVGIIGPTRLFEVAQDHSQGEHDDVMLAAMRQFSEGK